MADKKRIAVVLSGCGFKDGAEIHEAVLTLLAIDRQGAQYQCFAPDMEQRHVTNHLTGDTEDEKRNVLVESARIARGEIERLGDFRADEYDAIVFPGGFGAATSLCTFAIDGPGCSIEPGVESAIKSMKAAGKPIGAWCIAPVLLGKILGDVELTIGQDDAVAGALETMGAKHEKRGHGEIVVDEINKVVTTPCYMLDATIGDIADGTDNAIKAILSLI